VIDPEIALRAAIGEAFDDVGLTARDDEKSVELFLAALRDHGYIVIREINGTHPEARKE